MRVKNRPDFRLLLEHGIIGGKTIQSPGNSANAREETPEVGTQLFHDGRFIDRRSSYLKSAQFSYLKEEPP